MPLEEPSWWYGAEDKDLRIKALQPVARIYAWAAQRRFKKVQPYRSKLPVICVGNFTAGGTGKTPMSLLLAQLLIERGARPVFLTRGYSGKVKGSRWVDPAVDSAEEVGDEPLLLARSAPTLVSRDRAEGARLIEEVKDATHIIMDDGLQNPSLEKSLTIAVVDGRRGFGNGEVIPAGPLRAPLDFQFELAGCVVVNGEGDGAISAVLRRQFPGPLLSAGVEPSEEAKLISGERVIAYAGIGNPQRFSDLLQELGADVVGTRFFKDHHLFTEENARELIELAESTGGKLVTTEKDFVRLEGRSGDLAKLLKLTTPVGIEMTFHTRDMTRLEALIDGVRAVGAK